MEVEIMVYEYPKGQFNYIDFGHENCILVDNEITEDNITITNKEYPKKESIPVTVNKVITDEEIIELCKNTCTLHKTSSDGKFIVWFELDTLKEFIKGLEKK
jgi:hypothetical protein